MIPESRRSLGVGNGNPLQYSCLENSIDRGTRQATVHKGCKESDMTEATPHTQENLKLTQKEMQCAIVVSFCEP